MYVESVESLYVLALGCSILLNKDGFNYGLYHPRLLTMVHNFEVRRQKLSSRRIGKRFPNVDESKKTTSSMPILAQEFKDCFEQCQKFINAHGQYFEWKSPAFGTLTKKVSQGHHRASTSAQDALIYLQADICGQRLLSLLKTLLLCLDEEFQSKQSILPETVPYDRHPVLGFPLTAFNRKKRILYN
ncbi:hypothetical protein TNCV_1797051 [Trichonephila clavipes]|nr:hypothetical protein TNCV_1797051 [Trichonephila clavipes]